MRIVSLGYIMRDDWATDSPLSILVKKVLAFINIERISFSRCTKGGSGNIFRYDRSFGKEKLISVGV